MFLSSSRVQIPPGQNGSAVTVTMPLDGVAQEGDETFSLSISQLSLESLRFLLDNRTAIVSVMNGTIRDSDHK